MFDLHTHSLLSDGELLPSELARRYEHRGYEAIAITDHVDSSNIKLVIPAITSFCRQWPKKRITILPGIELTHIPLEHFRPLVSVAKKQGIKVIVAHGETVSEPVLKNTNRQALTHAIDILAHPGMITEDEARLAKKRGIRLEVTTRPSHRKPNKHVVRVAKKVGAKLIINNDSHSPRDILTPRQIRSFAATVGIGSKMFDLIMQDTRAFVKSQSQ